MKNIIGVLSIFIFLLIGCQENNSIVSPTNDGQDLEPLSKIPGKLFNKNEIQNDHKYIKVKKKLAKTYTINGAEGGKIIQKFTWYTIIDTLKLEAYLTIPSGAFDGELTFQIVFDPNEISMELHPTPFTFNLPVILDLKYKGLNQSFEVDPNNLDFQYFNPNGEYEPVDYQKIEWDPSKRELKVFKAALNHFSRYGWTRKR